MKLNTPLQVVAAQVNHPISVTYVSVYIQCHTCPRELAEELDALINQLPRPFMLLGDFNAHNQLWGSNKCDAKGKVIEDFVTEHNLVILNNGEHTRLDPRTGTTSAIDLTIISHDLASKLLWKAEPDTRTSDHFPIVISLPLEKPKFHRRRRWMHDQANWDDFEAILLERIPREHNLSIEQLSEHIIYAAENGTVMCIMLSKKAEKVAKS